MSHGCQPHDIQGACGATVARSTPVSQFLGLWNRKVVGSNPAGLIEEAISFYSLFCSFRFFPLLSDSSNNWMWWKRKRKKKTIFFSLHIVTVWFGNGTRGCETWPRLVLLCVRLHMQSDRAVRTRPLKKKKSFNPFCTDKILPFFHEGIELRWAIDGACWLAIRWSQLTYTTRNIYLVSCVE